VQKIQNLATYIEHTLLKPEATSDDIRRLCIEALTFQFVSVCVHTSYVQLCSERLTGSGVKVCSVIGFPLGASSTRTKKHEAEYAIEDGAREVDMVIHIGKLKSRDYKYVQNDIAAVVHTAHRSDALVKVILETGLLTKEEIIKVCELSKAAGADFVKTSTGFGKGGATVEDIILMRNTVGADMGVKASGGIRTRDDAEALIRAGANRIGTSASVHIVSESDVTTSDRY
jgi:deoxyribose-phosphate aldolase